MSLQTELIDKIRKLPDNQQLLVKALVDELARGRDRSQPTGSPTWFGALEHFKVEITEEDIAEARKEMWGNFPREIEAHCPLPTDH
jgi:hypothetical protein